VWIETNDGAVNAAFVVRVAQTQRA